MHALLAFSLGPIGRWVVLVGLVLAIAGGAYLKIRSDVRAEEEARRARAAQQRIIEMEHRNDAFRSLQARERCLVFARDSGLSAKICD